MMRRLRPTSLGVSQFCGLAELRHPEVLHLLSGIYPLPSYDFRMQGRQLNKIAFTIVPPWD